MTTGTKKNWKKKRRNKFKQTIEHFKGLCAYCQIEVYENVDHFLPRSRGGNNGIRNVVPCCMYCNSEKGDMLPDEYAKYLPPGRIEEIRKYLESV